MPEIDDFLQMRPNEVTFISLEDMFCLYPRNINICRQTASVRLGLRMPLKLLICWIKDTSIFAECQPFRVKDLEHGSTPTLCFHSGDERLPASIREKPFHMKRRHSWPRAHKMIAQIHGVSNIGY
jgi:hypothetical protein